MRCLLLATAAALAACSTPPPPRPAAAPAPAPAPAVTLPRADVLVSRARALRAEGDVAGAQERLETALQFAPDYEDARFELADLLLADDRETDRAAALLEGFAAKDGARHALLWARLAEARGDDAGAAETYGRALSLADDPDARVRRALALERLGRGDEAIPELERVQAQRPDDAVVRAHLAELYEAVGRLADAEAELRALAEAQPDRAAGWERLARFCERHGREAEAREALSRAREAGGRSDRALRPLPPSKR